MSTNFYWRLADETSQEVRIPLINGHSIMVPVLDQHDHRLHIGKRHTFKIDGKLTPSFSWAQEPMYVYHILWDHFLTGKEIIISESGNLYTADQFYGKILKEITHCTYEYIGQRFC